ncbi:MAG: glycosylase [Clostridiales bacterium]|nr:glycosylase [Clostridiales bacterium]
MPKWLSNAVFYQIYPQSFYDSNGDGIGDINGIKEKLGYIKDLGCNAIWINPCFESPFMDGGYDISDYYKVAARYGTNGDLKSLFEAAHSLGIKVLLDLVPGHTSDKHKWFSESKKPEKNEFSDRYIWTDSVWEAPRQYNFECGITNRDGNYMVNFFSSQPALNYGFNKITHPKWQMSYKSPECKRTVEAIKDVMRFWLDLGCDGFRVDMADSLVKNDDEKTATSEIWRDIRIMLDENYPEAAIISEWCCPQRAITCGFHSDFYLDHEGNGYHTAFRNDIINGEDTCFFSKLGKGDITVLTGELEKDLKQINGLGYVSFITGNHDIKRLSYRYDESELKVAICTILFLPGVPFIYYGDEIGMPYNESLKSKEGGFYRTGSRTPMQWDDSRNAGFSNANKQDLYLPVDDSENNVNVKAQSQYNYSLLNTIKKALTIRNEYNDFSAESEYETLFAQKHRYPYIFRRGDFAVCVNPSVESAKANIDITLKNCVFKIGDVDINGKNINMQGQSMGVFKL